MKILIINQPVYNRGDEAAHKALVYSLLQRFPDCSIEVLFVAFDQAAVDAFDLHDIRVSYTNLPARPLYWKASVGSLKRGVGILRYLHPMVWTIQKKMRKADRIISAPGGINLGGFYDWHHLFMLQLALGGKRRVFYYGRSIGPFDNDTLLHRRFNALAVKALQRVEFLSLRDPLSAQTASLIGLNYFQTLDPAFLVTPLAQLPEELVQKLEGASYGVVVPNYLIWHQDFSDKVSGMDVKFFFTNLIRGILNKFPEDKLVLLPQLFCGKTYLTRDADFFTELAKVLDEPRVIVLPETYNSDIQQAIIRESRYVVGARYHSIVFAINNDVPFVSMSYEHKMAGMLQSLCKTDRMVDLTKAFESAETREKAIADTLAKLDVLEKDPDALKKAKFLSSNCFEALAISLK